MRGPGDDNARSGRRQCEVEETLQGRGDNARSRRHCKVEVTMRGRGDNARSRRQCEVEETTIVRSRGQCEVDEIMRDREDENATSSR